MKLYRIAILLGLLWAVMPSAKAQSVPADNLAVQCVGFLDKEVDTLSISPMLTEYDYYKKTINKTDDV